MTDKLHLTETRTLTLYLVDEDGMPVRALTEKDLRACGFVSASEACPTNPPMNVRFDRYRGKPWIVTIDIDGHTTRLNVADAHILLGLLKRTLHPNEDTK